MVAQQHACAQCHGIVRVKTVKMLNFTLYTFYHTQNEIKSGSVSIQDCQLPLVRDIFVGLLN